MCLGRTKYNSTNDIIIDNNPDTSYTVKLIVATNETVSGLNKGDFIVSAGCEIGKEIEPGVFEFTFNKL